MKFFRTKKSDLPFFIGIPAVIWQLLFFYIPLIFILFSSVVRFAESGAIKGITFEKWILFLQPVYLRVIGSSFLLAITNTILCFLIAYPVAYFLAFTGKRFKDLLLFFLIVPFWTNFLLHVYAWFFVLEKGGCLNQLLLATGLISKPIHFLNTPFAIMIMMIYYYLPFLILPIYTSLERFDIRLIEASLDLGASWIHTFRRIMLPLSMRGIKAGFFLVYIPSFGEFAIPELMGGDKQMFVGSVVSHYIMGEQTGSLGAAFTAVASIALLLSAMLLYWLLNRLIKLGTSHG